VAELLALFVAKWNGPAPKLVEPLHRIDQVAVESISPHFSVGQHVQTRPELESNRLIDSTVFQTLEVRIRESALRGLFARFLEIGRAQQAPDNVASIHVELLFDSNPRH
jgi:hypothetical protein